VRSVEIANLVAENKWSQIRSTTFAGLAQTFPCRPFSTRFRLNFGEASRVRLRLHCSAKLFYTGPVVNAEMLVMMLEKHGIVPRPRAAPSGAKSLPSPAPPNSPAPSRLHFIPARQAGRHLQWGEDGGRLPRPREPSFIHLFPFAPARGDTRPTTLLLTELETLFDFGCYNYAAPDGAEIESHWDGLPGHQTRFDTRLTLEPNRPWSNPVRAG
jgi:hypothetical protein